MCNVVGLVEGIESLTKSMYINLSKWMKKSRSKIA
jgi:hypothetical protein